MAEYLMLERHIMQARARAMASDEKQLNRAAEGCDIYHDLGLPPGKDMLYQTNVMCKSANKNALRQRYFVGLL